MLQLLRRGHRRTRRDLDGLIDMAVIALVAVLILWQFWIAPSISDTSVPLFVRSVWASYPILDAILLAVVLRTLVELRTNTTMGVFLAAGVGLLADLRLHVPDRRPGGLGQRVARRRMDGGCRLARRRLPANPRRRARRRRSRSALRGRPGRPGSRWRSRRFSSPASSSWWRTTRARTPTRCRSSWPRSRSWRWPAPVRCACSSSATRAQASWRRASGCTAPSPPTRPTPCSSSTPTGVITNDAPNLAALLGYPGEQTRGHRALDFLSPDDVDSQDPVRPKPAGARRGAVGRGAHRRAPTAASMWLSTRAVNLLDDPDVQGIVVNLHDITDRKRAEDELVHQAFHDSLTGLANRALFRDRVEHALQSPSPHRLGPGRDLPRSRRVQERQRRTRPRGRRQPAARGRRPAPGASCVRATPSPDSAATSSPCSSSESSRGLVEAEAIAERVLQSLAIPVDDSATTTSPCRPASASPTPMPSRRRPRCSATPTSRCTRPRRAARRGGCSTNRRCEPRRSNACSSRTIWPTPSSATSSGSSTSPSSSSRRTASSGSRRCFAGNTPSSARSCPTSSSRSPRTTA